VLCCVVDKLIIDLSAYAEGCRPSCEIVVWSGGIAGGGQWPLRAAAGLAEAVALLLAILRQYRRLSLVEQDRRE
jgi:hypothetical protein